MEQKFIGYLQYLTSKITIPESETHLRGRECQLATIAETTCHSTQTLYKIQKDIIMNSAGNK
jgi:hypothetical protein